MVRQPVLIIFFIGILTGAIFGSNNYFSISNGVILTCRLRKASLQAMLRQVAIHFVNNSHLHN